jgi:TrmH family RNA methyltransferase
MLVKSRVKYIQSLGQKKFREQEGLFLAEGPKLVEELLEEGSSVINEIYAVKEWITAYKKLLGKTQVIEITPEELEKISHLSTPNKVLAIVKQYEIPSIMDLKGKITLVLDCIQDPGNMGTIIRIADWFGVHQIVCSPDSADHYNFKVVQATMGSISRVNVLYTDLNEWLSANATIPVYAAVLHGDDITGMKPLNEGILLIGNESKGISNGLLKHANIKITIPKKGKAESLNAAVATGIILSHIC